MGEFYSFFISDERWDRLSVDFIVEFSEFDGFDVVMNVVDFVSKRVYFISIYIIVFVFGFVNLYL
ncbi:hypothetical protein BGC24_19065 [Acinetobacter baumannii]|nr:hypothetical protein BGC24_19065 [Acinetobacter baumannii]